MRGAGPVAPLVCAGALLVFTGDAAARQGTPAPTAVTGQETPAEAGLKRSIATRVDNGTIRVDGHLDEAVWVRAPAITDFLDDASKAHFETVQRLLGKLGIAFELDRRLVRGLDYYTRTTFEFIYQPQGENALGTAGTVCGGGRYDRLVQELGGPDKPAVGFAMGLDRLVLLLESLHAPVKTGPALFIGTFDGPERDEAIALVMRLRDEGHFVDFDPRGGKIGKQKERASKVGAHFFAGYGGNEHASRTLKVDDLNAPREAPRSETVSIDALGEWLKAQR